MCLKHFLLAAALLVGAGILLPMLKPGIVPEASPVSQESTRSSEDVENEVLFKVERLAIFTLLMQYDSDADNYLDHGEVVKMLQDAGVGNLFTRPVSASQLIKDFDQNGDGKLSWREFKAVFKKPDRVK